MRHRGIIVARPPPIVSSVTDNVGDTAGGVPVTITGTNFTGATSAAIGGVALTSFIVVNATTITGVTGARAKGTSLDVVVQHPSGNSTGGEGKYEYWNPSSIASCVWWLRADLGVTVNGSTQVTAWADQSGVGDSNRNVTPPGADLASYNASDATYNNKATIGNFSKLTNCRLSSGIWSANYTLFTLGFVGHSVSANTHYFVTGTANSGEHGLLNSLNQPRMYGLTSASTMATATAGWDAAVGFGMGEWNGASSALYVNATATPNVSGTLTTAVLGDDVINVGAHSAGSSTFGVERLAEIFAFSAVLSAGDKVKLRKYINGRYAKNMAA